MQTFLPYDNFAESARVLDIRRLGKQRVEAIQILRTLVGISKGWQKHPAVTMWRGYEYALWWYSAMMIREWEIRGYKSFHCNYHMDILRRMIDDKFVRPHWMGNENFHRSHRSNLTRKFPEHYSQFWQEPDNLEYVWP